MQNRPVPTMSRRRCKRGVLGVAVLLVFGAADAARANVVIDVGRTLWGTMDRGGNVMYFILALSIAGLAIWLETAVSTRRQRVLPDRTVKLLDCANPRSMLEQLIREDDGSCFYRILKAGYKWRHGTSAQIQAAIEEAVDTVRWRFRRSIRAMGVISNAGPLLGLLGTVLGISRAFSVVSKQGALGDPSALAGGISEALLTTCFGLVVAIPMLLAYHYYLGKLDNLLKECEELAKEALILAPEESHPAAATPAVTDPVAVAPPFTEARHGQK